MKGLYTKILAVQSDLKTVPKGQDNPYFKSKYFDVNDVIHAIRPLLSKHGLVVIQPLSYLEGKQHLVTVVADPETGESMQFTTPLPENADPQKMGAAITYFRRYALTSLFLIQGDEDDDGNTASGKKVDEPFADNEPANSKTCPLCGKQHTGKYAKCWDCYKAKK